MDLSWFTFYYLQNTAWFKLVRKCVLSEMLKTTEVVGDNSVDAIQTAGATVKKRALNFMSQ